MRLLVNRWSTVSPGLSLQGCLTWIVSPGSSHLDCLGESAIKRVCCPLQFIHFTGNKKAVVIPRITGQRVLLNLTKMEDARIFVICLLSVATSSPTKSLCSSPSHQLFIAPHNLNPSYGSHTFHFSALQIRNLLPLHICESQSLTAS